MFGDTLYVVESGATIAANMLEGISNIVVTSTGSITGTGDSAITLPVTVNEGGQITGGAFSGSVTNNGTASGGTFGGTLLGSGSFAAECEFGENATVDSTFTGTITRKVNICVYEGAPVGIEVNYNDKILDTLDANTGKFSTPPITVTFNATTWSYESGEDLILITDKEAKFGLNPAENYVMYPWSTLTIFGVGMLTVYDDLFIPKEVGTVDVVILGGGKITGTEETLEAYDITVNEGCEVADGHFKISVDSNDGALEGLHAEGTISGGTFDFESSKDEDVSIELGTVSGGTFNIKKGIYIMTHASETPIASSATFNISSGAWLEVGAVTGGTFDASVGSYFAVNNNTTFTPGANSVFAGNVINIGHITAGTFSGKLLKWDDSISTTNGSFGVDCVFTSADVIAEYDGKIYRNVSVSADGSVTTKEVEYGDNIVATLNADEGSEASYKYMRMVDGQPTSVVQDADTFGHEVSQSYMRMDEVGDSTAISGTTLYVFNSTALESVPEGIQSIVVTRTGSITGTGDSAITLPVTVNEDGQITGGTFSGSVTNNGTASGGTFGGTLIGSGSFAAECEFGENATVDSTFTGTITRKVSIKSQTAESILPISIEVNYDDSVLNVLTDKFNAAINEWVPNPESYIVDAAWSRYENDALVQITDKSTTFGLNPPVYCLSPWFLRASNYDSTLRVLHVVGEMDIPPQLGDITDLCIDGGKVTGTDNRQLEVEAIDMDSGEISGGNFKINIPSDSADSDYLRLGGTISGGTFDFENHSGSEALILLGKASSGTFNINKGAFSMTGASSVSFEIGSNATFNISSGAELTVGIDTGTVSGGTFTANAGSYFIVDKGAIFTPGTNSVFAGYVAVADNGTVNAGTFSGTILASSAETSSFGVDCVFTSSDVISEYNGKIYRNVTIEGQGEPVVFSHKANVLESLSAYGTGTWMRMVDGAPVEVGESDAFGIDNLAFALLEDGCCTFGDTLYVVESGATIAADMLEGISNIVVTGTGSIASTGGDNAIAIDSLKVLAGGTISGGKLRGKSLDSQGTITGGELSFDESKVVHTVDGVSSQYSATGAISQAITVPAGKVLKEVVDGQTQSVQDGSIGYITRTFKTVTSVTIRTQSQSWPYDGAAHSHKYFDITIGAESAVENQSADTGYVYAGDTFNVTMSASVTDQSDTASNTASVTVVGADGADRSGEYDITVIAGTLSITAPMSTPTIRPSTTEQTTVRPTLQPTVRPTATPTVEPTATPTVEPTATPTAEPTATPTAEPTATPTVEPTATPTAEPTATPTVEPTATPTVEPTATPTAEPTATPTARPTATASPTAYAPRQQAEQLQSGVQVSGIVTDRFGNPMAYSPFTVSVEDELSGDATKHVLNIVAEPVHDRQGNVVMRDGQPFYQQRNLLIDRELLLELAQLNYTYMRLTLADAALEWSIEEMLMWDEWDDIVVRLAPMEPDELNRAERRAIDAAEPITACYRARITARIDGRDVDVTDKLPSLRVRLSAQSAGQLSGDQVALCLLRPRDDAPIRVLTRAELSAQEEYYLAPLVKSGMFALTAR